MGQRLVVNVYRNMKDRMPTAAIYYHWSGYTAIAIDTCNKIIDKFIDEKISLDKWDIRNFLLNFVYEEGGGLRDEAKIMNLFKEQKKAWNEKISRNNGILSVGEEAIRKHNLWGEAFANLYLEDEMIGFGDLLWSWESIDDWEEDEEVERRENEGEEFIKMYYDLKDCICPFKYRENLLELVREADDYGAVIVDGERVYATI